MSLIGKTVSISNKGLLEFFYPSFEKKDKLFFDKETRVIYVGEPKPNIIRFLTLNTKEFINTVGISDIDLDERENMVKFVYEKHNKTVKDNTKEILLNMSELDFINYVKKYWVGGYSELDDDKKFTIFDLYKALNDTNSKAVYVYFSLREYLEFGTVKNSLVTFFEKVRDINDISANPYYMRILQDFNSKKRKNLKALLEYLLFDEGDQEYKLVSLLYNI